MKKKDDGGPAYPAGEAFRAPGMSLRDWFAGQALAGYSTERPPNIGDTEVDVAVRRRFARSAYMMADAMLEARKS